MELQIETRNLEIQKEWHERIDDEKDKLVRHHAGLVQHLRITLEDASQHKEGGYELRLVASVKNDTMVVKRKGESIMPILVEAFDVLGLKLKEMQRKKRKNFKSKKHPPLKTGEQE